MTRPVVRFAATTLSLATHNLHDTGTARALADVIVWTEAGPQIDQLEGMRHWRPRRNRSLGVSWDPAVLTVTGRRYRRAHRGRATITPARGYLEIRGTLVDGTRVGVLGGHWINNSDGPDVRGNRALRVKLWHTMTRAVLVRKFALEQRGVLVWVLGDINRHTVTLEGLRDSHGAPRGPYDRVFGPDTRRVLAGPVTRGPLAGSDHRPAAVTYRIVSRV